MAGDPLAMQFWTGDTSQNLQEKDGCLYRDEWLYIPADPLRTQGPSALS